MIKLEDYHLSSICKKKKDNFVVTINDDAFHVLDDGRNDDARFAIFSYVSLHSFSKAFNSPLERRAEFYV